MEGPFSILCGLTALSFIAFVGVVFARAIGRIDAEARMDEQIRWMQAAADGIARSKESRSARRQKGRK